MILVAFCYWLLLGIILCVEYITALSIRKNDICMYDHQVCLDSYLMSVINSYQENYEKKKEDCKMLMR